MDEFSIMGALEAEDGMGARRAAPPKVGKRVATRTEEDGGDFVAPLGDNQDTAAGDEKTFEKELSNDMIVERIVIGNSTQATNHGLVVTELKAGQLSRLITAGQIPGNAFDRDAVRPIGLGFVGKSTTVTIKVKNVTAATAIAEVTVTLIGTRVR